MLIGSIDDWFNKKREEGHDVMAIKGPPPEGAIYDDGTPIINPINIGWFDVQTGEKILFEDFDE
jgi:hypothetical protein